MLSSIFTPEEIRSFFNWETVPFQYDRPRVHKLNFAGVAKEDIKVEVIDNHLEVKGDDKKYRVILTSDDDTDNISAKYNNGLLTITINPKEKNIKEIKIS